MKILLIHIFLCICLLTNYSFAQSSDTGSLQVEIIHTDYGEGYNPYQFPSSETDSAFHALISTITKRKINRLPIGEEIAAIGKLLLNRPYIEKSLELSGADEKMTVCNFKGF